MHVLFRFISLILIVVAVALIGGDFVTSLERGGVVTVHSYTQIWALLSKNGEASFMAWLPHALPGPLPGWIMAVLALPAWSIGVLGVILAFLFGRHATEAD
jgi:hypothetical protein